MAYNLKYSPTPEFDRWLSANGPLDVSKYVEELERAERERLTERIIDDYDSKNEESIWRQTKQRSEMPRRYRWFGPFQNRPALSFHLQNKMLRKILRSDPACKSVVDFGALYAKPDADIAKAFPHVNVFAVDRSQNIKRMNEEAFPDIPNLVCAATDILTFMRDQDLRGGLLIHALTGICLLPEMMRKLYRQCAASGIKHVVVIELTGYSHQLRQFYDYNGSSAVLRHGMISHNYPAMLQAAGYDVRAAELIPCPMPKPIQRDAHLICIHARLAGTTQQPLPGF
jgi:hypothetical protein